jgi:predicted site-specific integrase-resolvase
MTKHQRQSLADKQRLNPQDVADILGHPYRTVYDQIRNGSFKTARQDGRFWTVDREEVMELTTRLGGRNA